MQGNRAGTLLLNSNKNIIKSSHTDIQIKLRDKILGFQVLIKAQTRCHLLENKENKYPMFLLVPE